MFGLVSVQNYVLLLDEVPWISIERWIDAGQSLARSLWLAKAMTACTMMHPLYHTVTLMQR